MERHYTLEFLRATEVAAIASARYMGRGDERAADAAAVEAMRSMLNTINFYGRVVIGEGERDQAPMLYIGEEVGKSEQPKLDIALDPLEGTTICARGGTNACAVIAVAEQGNFLHAPDLYMEKIAVGPRAKGVVSLLRTPTENLHAVAKANACKIEDLTVCILDRERHQELIKEVRAAGARIFLIGDGDVSAAIATANPDSDIDILMGSGGAPEGVLAAAALRCVGGDIQGKLICRNIAEAERAKTMGVDDLDRIYDIDSLANGDVVFCATGVTTGTFLQGVKFYGRGRVRTHSVVMRSQSGTVRYITAEHDLPRKFSDMQ